MAIQMRRGEYDDFDASKMLAGELAVVVSGDPETEGGALYVATAAGSATRVAFANEIPGDATTTSDGLMSAADKAKLDGVAAGAQANVIESVSVNGTAVDVNNKNAAISIPQASSDSAGLMTASDKTKLNGIEAGANAYTLPAATTAALGGVKPDGTTVTVDADGTIHSAGGSGGSDGKLAATAEALLGADSAAQWAQRESTGSGAATVRSVQGATVVWAQMVQNGDFANGDHWTKVSNHFNWTTTDNTAVLTSIDDGYAIGLSSDVVALVDGHKYLASCYAKTSNANALYVSLNSNSGTINAAATNVALSNAFQKVGGIVTYSPPSSGTDRVRIATGAASTVSGDVLTLANVQLFDLTAMFGAGNEPTTVAEFEAMYPESYYPYSAPTLKPVQISGIRSTDAQGGELDSVEWTAQTLRAAGSVRDELTSGELVTRVGQVTYDGTESWSFSSSIGFYRAMPSDAKGVVAGGGEATSNLYPLAHPTSSTGFNDKTFCVSNGSLSGSNRIIVKDSSYETVDAFKAALELHPLQVTYELATPTTTPISPALPMTYRVEQGGTESIIVPTGEVSATPVLTVAEGESAVDVVMDALACIATPDGPVATANHAVGTYLTMQGKLYKVTSAIAVGETIKAGTNATETTVMAELSALAN